MKKIILSKKLHRYLKRTGDNIRHARLREKMTQEQLAKKIGVSQYHVSRIEWGDQCLKIYLLFKISEVLNIMPGEILDVVTPARFYGGFDARKWNSNRKKVKSG